MLTQLRKKITASAGETTLDAAMQRQLQNHTNTLHSLGLGSTRRSDPDACPLSPADAIGKMQPEVAVWVQCCEPACNKWRRMPPGYRADDPRFAGDWCPLLTNASTSAFWPRLLAPLFFVSFAAQRTSTTASLHDHEHPPGAACTALGGFLAGITSVVLSKQVAVSCCSRWHS